MFLGGILLGSEQPCLSADSHAAGLWPTGPLWSVGSVREGGPEAGCDHGGEGGDRRVAKARRTTAHSAEAPLQVLFAVLLSAA